MMAKITTALGPTNADEPEDDGARVDVQEPMLPGEPAQDYGEPAEDADGQPDDGDQQDDARALYEEQTVEDLKTELRERNRGLAVTGNKPELVDRLLKDDAHQAAEQHDDGGR